MSIKTPSDRRRMRRRERIVKALAEAGQDTSEIVDYMTPDGLRHERLGVQGALGRLDQAQRVRLLQACNEE